MNYDMPVRFLFACLFGGGVCGGGGGVVVVVVCVGGWVGGAGREGGGNVGGGGLCVGVGGGERLFLLIDVSLFVFRYFFFILYWSHSLPEWIL